MVTTMRRDTGATPPREACDILLVAADWQSRALLLAELQEAGYAVRALPGLRQALRALIGRRLRPRLILLDVHGDSDAAPPYAAQLADLAGGVPLVLLIGAFDAAAWGPFADRDAEILRRPVSVGQVAAAVRRRLGRPQPDETAGKR